MVATTYSAPRGRSAWLNPRGAALSAIVFFGGVCSIAVETSASRLVGPYFGSSTFIWANLIGLTLLYLTLGYFIGGRLADRYPDPELLFVMTAIAGFSVAFIPLLSRPILEISLSAFDNVSVGAFYGSLLGTMLLFAIPVTLLGCISPFAVRLRLAEVSAAGNTAGSLYALSTVGSIIGSFLPTFVLIPVFGTRTNFLILSLTILIPSVLALLAIPAVRELALAIAMLLVVAVAPIFQPSGLIRPPEYGTVIHEAETPYNYVQVIKYRDEIRLALNEGHATHSIYSPDQKLTGGPWDYFMVGPYFNVDQTPEDVQSMLMIGLAAGTVAQQFTEAYGPIPIDGVEIDGEIVEIGREYFNMNEPNLNVIVDDGRYYLSRSEKKYDVIGVDAYRQPYIPFHLTTKEFFESARDHLTDDGVVVLNAGRTSTDFRLVNVMASTMAAVFPNVYIIDVDRFTNSMVIATNEPTDIENFAANMAGISEDSMIRQVGDIAMNTGNIREWTGHDRVFTDDLAPVELVVDQIILRAATEEQ